MVAQNQVPQIKWQKCFGSAANEFVGSGNVDFEGGYPKNIVADRDGGVLISGTVSTNINNSSNHHGQIDAWVTKLDAQKNTIWSKCYGGSKDDYIFSLQVDRDGGYVLGMSTSSTDNDATGNHGSDDVLIIKLDRDGNIVWKRCYGGTGGDAGCQIQVVDDGYVFVAMAISNDGDVSGNHGNSDTWAVRLDNNGDIVWQRCLGGSGVEIESMIKPVNDGGFIIASYTQSTDGDAQVPDPGQYSGTNLWIVKLRANGQLEWQNRLHVSVWEFALDLEITPDGGFIIAGFGRVYNHAALDNDGLIAKFDAFGKPQWHKFIGGSKDDIFSDIIILPDQTFMVAGITLSNDIDVKANYGNSDVWLVNLDQLGNILWEKTYGGSGSESGATLVQTNNETFYLLSSTTSRDFDVVGNNGNLDIWLIEIGSVNTITGQVFYDANSNGIKDAGENYYNDIRIEAEKNSQTRSAIPSNGAYTIFVDTGNYTTLAIPLKNYQQVVPASVASSFTTYFNTDTVDFAIQPIPGHRDLSVSIINLSFARPGFDGEYKIEYSNVGTETIAQGAVTLVKDRRIDYLSATINPDTYSGNIFTWNFSDLKPNETRSFVVKFNFNVNALRPGQILELNVNITPIDNDEFPGDNTDTVRQAVTSSYDPNDKAETHAGIISPQQVSKGEPLTYLVRFQNVGNDTAFTVAIRDTLDANLDWNSLEMLSASHTYNLQIKDGNKLTWKFENILLPDSNINEPGSHGYISFRIKPLKTLVTGDVIHNSASIYFDFNLPVRTNIETTTVKLPRPPDPYMTGLQSSYCGAVGSQKIKIHNLPASASGITVTASINGSSIPIAADSTFTFNVSTLSSGTHQVAVQFSNTTANRTASSEFMITAAETPDVNLSANNTTITNLTTPVILTAVNASGGGTAPLYTFARDKNFTNILQPESGVNTCTFLPALLAIGDNKIFIRMKSNAGCVVTNTAVDSILLVRSAVTGINDPDMPGQMININPNPFRNVIIIKGLSPAKTYTVTLYNFEGKKLMQRRISNRSGLDITRQHQANGIYWLSVYDEKRRVLLGTVKLVRVH